MKRPLRTAPDSIWISDDMLYAVFKRFCAPPKTIKRRGSSVPGPMEGRRRLGKRRMTQLSEAIPTPASNQGLAWGFLGAVDRTQWRWEAPTPRPAKKEGGAFLPTWLSEWDTTSPDAIREGSQADIMEEKSLDNGARTIREGVFHFRQIFSCESDPDSQITEFSRKLEQNLALGLVSGDTLAFALHQITKCIRDGSKSAEIEPLCHTFYSSVWRGICASKVLGPVDFEGNVLNEFIGLLSYLPSTREVQVLAHHILSSVSSSQLQCMEHGIISLVKAWSKSWLQAPSFGNRQVAIQRAEHSVAIVEAKCLHMRSLSMKLDGQLRNKNEFIVTKQAISAIEVAIHQGLKCIADAEEVVLPWKASSKLLADALRNVPYNMFLRIISPCLEDVTRMGESLRWERRVIRYNWLSALAQMPSIDTQYFIQTWRKLEAPDGILDNESSDLILSHWISQGYIKNPTVVRNSFEATAQQPGMEDFASLLFTLGQHGENVLTRTRELFLILDDLGKYKRVYTILSRMNDLGLKVPANCLGRSIDTMKNYDVRLALKTFHLHKVMLIDEKPVRLDWIPNFIIALINHRGITPKHIWKILGIPVYESLPRSQRHFERSPMSETMRDLLHKMALAFAYSDARPPRVALRNVLQCLYHLRVHRAPIGPELSRAVTRIGITDEIGNGKWIRQERLRYALHLINELEGKDVAKKADATVLNWRIYLSEKQARENREGNVLRLGPIG